MLSEVLEWERCELASLACRGAPVLVLVGAGTGSGCPLPPAPCPRGDSSTVKQQNREC